MNRKFLIWSVSVALTLVLSYWQRKSGPSYPARGTVRLAGAGDYQLDRSHAGPGDAKVRLICAPTVGGRLLYRRAGTGEAWTNVAMKWEGGELAGFLPHQPIAGRLDYQVMLQSGPELVWLNGGRNVTLRFRGDVPIWILAPHILAMFLGFLFAARAGLGAWNGEDVRWAAIVAFTLITVGGMILGPIVQKYAFGEYWTGWPLGPDLTDNKTAVAWLFWLVPLWSRRRIWTMLAALMTFIVFAIPHSWLSGNVAP